MKKLLVAVGFIIALTSSALAEQIAFNDDSVNNITAIAYRQLIASTSYATNAIFVSNTSGQPCVLALGAIGSEVDSFLIPANFTGTVQFNIPQSSRLSVKSKSATSSTGFFQVTVINKI